MYKIKELVLSFSFLTKICNLRLHYLRLNYCFNSTLEKIFLKTAEIFVKFSAEKKSSPTYQNCQKNLKKTCFMTFNI